MKKKVAIAMSGGVDSGLAAALVVKAGYQAAGFHMHLWAEGLRDKRFENKCCSTESLEAARKTADQLGIPFYKVDFLEEIFKKRVVDYFLKEYGLGRTPNPCVMCNQFIKFGELMGYAKNLGYDYLVTGHYARITEGQSVTNFSLMSARKNKNIPRQRRGTSAQIRSKLSLRAQAQSGRFHLLMGKDKKKDQSYFLYNLNQKKLAQIMFPVGDYLKTEVIKMARKWKLPVAERPESQEICFYPEKDYRPFLKRQIKEKIIPGEVVDIKGKMIGEHQGLPLYTIGQRHGFRITDKKVIGPLYVIDKKIKKNRLVVGFGKEAERKEFLVKDVNWISGKTPKKEIEYQVRIRHQGELLGAKIRVEKPKIKVILDELERGVAPGQAAVFYQGEEVLGGGLITIDKA